MKKKASVVKIVKKGFRKSHLRTKNALSSQSLKSKPKNIAGKMSNSSARPNSKTKSVVNWYRTSSQRLSFISKSISRGKTGNQIYKEMKKKGLGQRKQTFYNEYRKLRTEVIDVSKSKTKLTTKHKKIPSSKYIQATSEDNKPLSSSKRFHAIFKIRTQKVDNAGNKIKGSFRDEYYQIASDRLHSQHDLLVQMKNSLAKKNIEVNYRFKIKKIQLIELRKYKKFKREG